MPTSYCVRLFSADPADTASLVISGAPGSLATYGPRRYVSGWAASVVAGSLAAAEQLVSFSDPDLSGNISNLDPIIFRVRDEQHRWEVSHVGIVASSAQGADHTDTLMEPLLAAPAIAWPGGRVLAEPQSELTVDAGALTFTV